MPPKAPAPKRLNKRQQREQEELEQLKALEKQQELSDDGADSVDAAVPEEIAGAEDGKGETASDVVTGSGGVVNTFDAVSLDTSLPRDPAQLMRIAERRR